MSSSSSNNNFATANFCPDPVPFIALARECGLRVIFVTGLYSLCCGDSSSRKKKLSRLKREDLEAFTLGRERMMSFICGPAGLELGILSWEIDPAFDDRARFCTGSRCRIPAMRAWLEVVQDTVCQGDPLKTLRSYSQRFRQYLVDHYEDEEWNCGEYDWTEMCRWCLNRMADGLDDLRSSLFDRLPSLFSPDNLVSR